MKEQFDTDSIRKRNPIVDIVRKSVALKRSGATFTGFCPFHDNRRTPSFVVWPETGTWRCFGVCAEGGDVIAFVMKRDGIDFVEACKLLGGEVTAPAVRTPRPVTPDAPPSLQWQAMGSKLIGRAQEILHSPSGSKARVYLCNQRLLNDWTIERWHLGFIPADTYMPFEAWGLPAVPDRPRGLWLPRGIVIPTFDSSNRLWAIHVRRAEGDPKYPHITGSKKSLWGSQNVDRRCVFVFGGEFDAMLAEQEGALAGGSCSPSTGEGSAWSSAWTNHMLNADLIVGCYDNDDAGQRGVWRNVISTTGRAVSAPPFLDGSKDLTDYARNGGDVRAWMMALRETYLTATDNAETLWERITRLYEMREEHFEFYGDLKFDFATATER